MGVRGLRRAENLICPKSFVNDCSYMPLQVLGQFQCTIESSHKKITTAKVFVVKNATGCLLSGHTVVELDLINVKVNTVTCTEPTFTEIQPCLTSLIQEYSDVFTGIGNLKDLKIHLHIDPSVQPVVRPQVAFLLPFATKCKFLTLSSLLLGLHHGLALSLFSQNLTIWTRYVCVLICTCQTKRFRESITHSQLSMIL